jgi:hypothetical protein
MSARNCQELGINLQKICSRLLANDNLVKLLYHEGLDPLTQEALTDEAKKKIFNDLLCIVPRVGAREDGKSTIAIYIPNAAGLSGNSEFKSVTIAVDVFVPLTQWIIKDSNLRPFAIMGEIQNSLNGKTINGLGRIKGGDFDLVLLTDEMSTYHQVFTITEYE